MASKAPKHFLQAHRLICGRDRLRRNSQSKAEYKLFTELRSIFEDRNIVGLGISEKVTNQKKAGELTLCFYVRQKKAKNRLGSHKMIPPVVSVAGGKSIFTDVYQIGRLKAQANVQVNPIQSGFSGGNDRSVNAGTVGAIVSSGAPRFILSNAHVLAPQGHGTPGTVNATFPAFKDSNQGMRRVGVLRHIVNLQSSGNLADAALAEISPGFVANNTIFGAKLPYTVGLAEEKMSVIGRGRTTTTISAVVKDPHFAGPIAFPGQGDLGFVEQILCIGGSAEGDSGAMICSQAGQLLGILVAGSGNEFIVTTIKGARDSLGVNFQFVAPGA